MTSTPREELALWVQQGRERQSSSRRRFQSNTPVPPVTTETVLPERVTLAQLASRLSRIEETQARILEILQRGFVTTPKDT